MIGTDCFIPCSQVSRGELGDFAEQGGDFMGSKLSKINAAKKRWNTDNTHDTLTLIETRNYVDTVVIDFPIMFHHHFLFIVRLFCFFLKSSHKSYICKGKADTHGHYLGTTFNPTGSNAPLYSSSIFKDTGLEVAN